MVTRADVARRAGVSTAVVSYVVNNGPRPVAGATRERVLAAMSDLDYRPNAVARALRARRTCTVGLIVPDLNNPFFAQLARAVEDSAFARGYALLLGSSTEDVAREEAYIKTFLERQVDALLLISVRSAPDVEAASTSGTTVLVLDRSLPARTTVDLVVNDEEGAFAGTGHLLEHGHRRVGCLGGPADVAAAEDRRRGWARALTQAGLSSDDELLARSAFTRAGGYEAASHLLAAADRPTAIFASSDVQAIGALRAAADLGLRVPEDVALLAFDGTEDAAYTIPRLSTMVQPVTELADRALDQLLALATDDGSSLPDGPLPLTLLRRGSCGCRDDA